MESLGKSDHDGLLWNYVTESDIILTNNDNNSLNYSKGDNPTIRDELTEVKWNERLQNLNCEDSWQVLQEVYHDVVTNNVPLKKKSKSNPPWLKPRVNKSIKRKHQHYQR